MSAIAEPQTPDTPDPFTPRVFRVTHLKEEIDQVFTFRIAPEDPGHPIRAAFRPGQFNMLYLPGAGESAISLSGHPENDQGWDHTIRRVGNVTRGLGQLSVGQTLGLRGPFGQGWPYEECLGRDIVLVAGGIGLPPLRPLIYQLSAVRKQVGKRHLLYGSRTPDSLLYQSEYKSWTADGWTIQKTVDRSSPGWTGNVGVVTLLLERLHSFEARNTVLFCCGPEVMMRFVARTAVQRGIPPSRIWISVERPMQCGFGLCGRCQLGPWLVCRDGPVFRYDRIAPALNVEGW